MVAKQETRIHVEGMHCAGCITRVTAALKKVNSVEVEDVQVGSARVLYDAACTSPPLIAAAIDRIGFQSRLE